MRKFLVGSIVLVIALVSAMGAVFAQEDSSDTTTVTSTPWLGVRVADQNEQVIIAGVQANSPAAEAGLLIGDVIVSFNGEAVTSVSDLTAKVAAATVGDVVTLELQRAGEAVSVDVTLAARTGRGGRGFDGQRGMDLTTVEPLAAAEWLLHVDLEEAEGGFQVDAVVDQYNPYQLQAGDVITKIGDQTAAELNFQTLMESLSSMDTPQLTVTVMREGAEVTLEGNLMGGHGGFDGGNRAPGFDGGMPGDRNGGGRDGRGMPGMPGGNNGNSNGSQNNLDTPVAPEVDGQA